MDQAKSLTTAAAVTIDADDELADTTITVRSEDVEQDDGYTF
ncbi:hypothetical protein ACH41E_30405 [Streptomyces sp. NPDC020412]